MNDGGGHGDLGRELASIAESLAREAGAMARRGRRSGTIEATTKSSPTDMVTLYDAASEELIVNGLRAARPRDGLVGEEGTESGSSSGITWHIDPIDGTSNFLFDLPTWSVSIGAVDAAGPLAGAVYVPVLEEMFVAARGSGATLNGLPISVSGATDLSTALIGTGFGYDRDRRSRHARTVAAIIGEVRDIRRLGAASVDICFVACGRLDAYFERDLHSWDLVAGQIIAAEAGAITSDFSGGPIRPAEALAATPGIHAAFIDLLGSVTVGGA